MTAYAGTVQAPRDPDNPDSYKVRRDVGAGLFSESDQRYIQDVAVQLRSRPERFEGGRAPASEVALVPQAV